MPEKTKPEKDNPNEPESKAKKIRREKTESEDGDVWSKDQQKKSYYYDDAYGYEIYNPDEDEDE